MADIALRPLWNHIAIAGPEVANRGIESYANARHNSHYDHQTCHDSDVRLPRSPPGIASRSASFGRWLGWCGARACFFAGHTRIWYCEGGLSDIKTFATARAMQWNRIRQVSDFQNRSTVCAIKYVMCHSRQMILDPGDFL